MSKKREVRIGAGDWWEENPKRFGVYNANYIGHFDKWREGKLPWNIAAPNGHPANGKSFKTCEAATTYLREKVLKP